MGGATPYRPWSRWNKHRQRCFDEKGRICQVQLVCDGAAATEVDHIVPWRDGGAWYELDNLRPSCKACNISRASNQKHQTGWERAGVDIVLVDDLEVIDVGIGDVVLERGALETSLAGGGVVTPAHAELASAVFARLVADLRRGELLDSGRVWLVDGRPRAAEFYPFHSVRRSQRGSETNAGETQGQGQGQGQGRHAVEGGRW